MSKIVKIQNNDNGALHTGDCFGRPLQVGDQVRILSGGGHLNEKVLTVTYASKVGANGLKTQMAYFKGQTTNPNEKGKGGFPMGVELELELVEAE